jgi:hypothetical protein
LVLRIDHNTGKTYQSYWDWLRRDGHAIWIPLFFFAYGWYLGSTEDVKAPPPAKKTSR